MFFKSYLHTFLLGLVFGSLFLLAPAISQAACANVPVSGSYTVSSSCAFANTVDGVDGGGITVNAGATLTINAGQTIVWSPGSSIVINGAIAIANGAQLKQTYLWVTDSDNDGYPSSTTMVAQDTAPTGGKRRSAITKFTYVTDSSGANAMKIDADDSSATIYPGTACNGDCSVNDDNGNCVAKAAGENGLPACQRCDGSSLSHVNVSTFADSEGTNTCAGTCAGYCSSGSCVSTDTSAGTCTVSSGARIASGGDGHCSAGSCAADCYANGTSCSSGSDCCSGYCYADADGDGYGVSAGAICQASASLGTDCYDNNADAHPGQTSYFSVDRGDGSFDYDCDGSETKYGCTYQSLSLSGSKTCFYSASDCEANTGSIRTTYSSCSTVTNSMTCGQTADSKKCTTSGYEYCPTTCTSATRYRSSLDTPSGSATCSCK